MTSSIKLLNTSQLLSDLKESISKAKQNIMIVGPWLDAFFIKEILKSLNDNDLEFKFVVRLDKQEIDKKTLSALNLARLNLKNFQAKSLNKLHTKVILIDEKVFYLGSANWYWYSLHESIELTIKGSISELPGLMDELNIYWNEGSPIAEEDVKDFTDFEPFKEENYFF